MSISQNFPTTKPSLLLDFANTKSLDPRIDFARASGGVYYDGKTVAKAEENLLLHSEAFNSWPQSALTITPDSTTAPDGTTTADLIDDGTAGAFHFVYRQDWLRGQPKYAFSFYAKDVDRQYVLAIIYFNTSNRASVLFDLTAGTVADTSVAGTGYAVDSSAIVDVGDGWYRCSGVFSVGSPATFGICPSDSATAGYVPSYTGSNKQLYLWGAQLEARDSVTAYTPTTTQPITNYIPVLQTAPANVARFDHDPVTGESLGLLVEEQRTNLVLRSEEFSTIWEGTNTTVESNTVVAPDGTLTGDKIVANSGVSYHVRTQNPTIAASAVYTLSCFLKRGEYQYGFLYSDGAAKGLIFDLDNLTVTGSILGAPTSYTIIDVGNGWVRCAITFTSGVSTNSRIWIGPTSSPTSGLIGGDGYSGIYIWGAQLEASAFPTSYIKTEASQVTRSADSASMTGANFSEWYRPDEGSFYLGTTTQQLSGAVGAIFAVSDGTVNNRLSLLRYGSQFNLFAQISGAIEVNMNATGTVTPNEFFKTSFGYAVNDYATSVNGNLIATDTSARVPFVTQMNLFSQVNAGGAGTIKKIAYYPARLTNEQLQALTT